MSRTYPWPAGELERRLREERRLQIAEAREFAELMGDVEIRDGREYRVVRLDDAYDDVMATDREVRFHRKDVQLMREMTRGPNPLRGEL